MSPRAIIEAERRDALHALVRRAGRLFGLSPVDLFALPHGLPDQRLCNGRWARGRTQAVQRGRAVTSRWRARHEKVFAARAYVMRVATRELGYTQQQATIELGASWGSWRLAHVSAAARGAAA